MPHERFGIEQLVPILPLSKRAGCLTLIINRRRNQCLRLCLVHPLSVSCSGPFLISFSSSNVAFYNLLSACVLFCVKGLGVDPFYKWSDGCNLVVPMTRDYPFKAVVTTDIPPWASKQLSSSGSFDPSVVMRGESSYLPLSLAIPCPAISLPPQMNSQLTPHGLLANRTMDYYPEAYSGNRRSGCSHPRRLDLVFLPHLQTA